MKYKDKYLQEKDSKEYAQQSFENIRKQNVELLEQIERLQEQLNEANEILMMPDHIQYHDEVVEMLNNYTKKWGVK